MENQEQDNDQPAEGRAAGAYDSDRYQRSGATIFFWVLVAILFLIGTCVLVSLLLVSVKGY